jgi:serine/threonine protein phosphatase PrpC
VLSLPRRRRAVAAAAAVAAHIDLSCSALTAPLRARAATHQVDCAISGITLSAAFLRGDELYVGNAGDCRAVIGRLKGKKGSGTYEAIDLTVDHRPDRPDEKSRIEKCGGRVEPVKLQNHDEYVGPMRVWCATQRNSPTTMFSSETPPILPRQARDKT